MVRAKSGHAGPGSQISHEEADSGDTTSLPFSALWIIWRQVEPGHSLSRRLTSSIKGDLSLRACSDPRTPRRPPPAFSPAPNQRGCCLWPRPLCRVARPVLDSALSLGLPPKAYRTLTFPSPPTHSLSRGDNASPLLISPNHLRFAPPCPRPRPFGPLASQLAWGSLTFPGHLTHPRL